MPVNYPFVPDNVGEDAFVVPRGEYAFLKVHLRKYKGGPLVAPDPGWETHPSVFALTDPDDAPLAWQTNAVDPEGMPDGSVDVYDESHATYTGIPGLFHDGGGNIALKVKVPENAEVTVGNMARAFNIAWEVLRNGDHLPYEEDFNVNEAGVLVFSTGVISVQDVKDGFNTSLDDPQIERLIERATNRKVRGWLEACGIDPDTHPSFAVAVPPQVQEAIILATQGLIATRDTSANTYVAMRKQGNKQIRYSVSGDKLAGGLMQEARDEILAFCRIHNRPRFRSTRRHPNDAPWDPRSRERLP